MNFTASERASDLHGVYTVSRMTSHVQGVCRPDKLREHGWLSQCASFYSEARDLEGAIAIGCKSLAQHI